MQKTVFCNFSHNSASAIDIFQPALSHIGKGRGGETAAETLWTAQDAYLVVEFGVDEGVEHLAAALDNDTLHLALVQLVQGFLDGRGAEVEPVRRHIGQSSAAVQHHGLWRRA